MEKTIKHHFYQCEMPKKETRSFEELLHVIDKVPDDINRAKIERNNEFAVRHSQMVFEDKAILGGVMKIRLKEVPVKASLTGKNTPIALASDEGIGEETVFLYDKKLNILVFQFNTNSIRAGKFIDYIEGHCKVNGEIMLLPVLKGDAYKRMLNMAEPLALEVAVAELTKPTCLKSEINSVKMLKRANETIKSPVLSIRYAVGHGKAEKGYGSKLMEAVNDFLRFKADGGNVTKLKISGKMDSESSTEVVDLLLDRMVSDSQIEITTNTIPINIRLSKIKEVWLAARSDLMEMFSKDD
ncbi:MAG: hypothetical protein C0410_13725 [Anaerolinea sp.]|nr:hypothetical protein [Anaerolinea sp.]